jgi:hypothetical protein
MTSAVDKRGAEASPKFWVLLTASLVPSLISDQTPIPVGNSILLATDVESGDAPPPCERFVA